MGTLSSLSQGLASNASLLERVRFMLHHFWRGDLPAEVPETGDPPVVGRRVTDEGNPASAKSRNAPRSRE
jgi:hypothetical protein